LQNLQKSLLRLEQVSLKAPVASHYLLENVSFAVFQGDFLGITGASGAGKTTLLRVLNRLSEVSQGQIFFEEQDIRQLPVIQLRQQISLVPQESKLLGMTVREALAYPLVLRGIGRKAIDQRLQTGIELMHIPTEWLERTEVQLSVGQRQLVALARSVILQPKILLLDEPTSALDAGRGEYVLSVLQELTETTSITILMVNHQLEFVQQFCNRLLYLHQGQLIQDLPAAQVDWLDVKQTLIDAEAEAAAEWA
jgi:D-methionine transport system ATP-binding protein